MVVSRPTLSLWERLHDAGNRLRVEQPWAMTCPVHLRPGDQAWLLFWDEWFDEAAGQWWIEETRRLPVTILEVPKPNRRDALGGGKYEVELPAGVSIVYSFSRTSEPEPEPYRYNPNKGRVIVLGVDLDYVQSYEEMKACI